MKRIHWKLGMITLLTTGMGLMAINEPCIAQGQRSGKGGNQGGGNQGGAKQGGAKQGGGNQSGGKQGGRDQRNQGRRGGGSNQGGGNAGAQGGVKQGGGVLGGGGAIQGGSNQGGGFKPSGGPPTGGGPIQNQGIRPPSFGGNQPPNGFRSPSLDPSKIRVPNFANGQTQGNRNNSGIRINPNIPGNVTRPNGTANPITQYNNSGRNTTSGQNAINRTVNRPAIGNLGNIGNIANIGNRFYNGNNLNAGVGLYQPAYTRHSGYHGYWNSNRGPLGGYGYNNGQHGGLGSNFGGYGIANGTWGYGNRFGGSYGSGYGRNGGYGYSPLGWGLGEWGLGSLIYNSGYLGYSNPYYSNSSVSVYNYSQPIPVTYNISNSTVDVSSNSSDQIFADVVAAFRRNDYDTALDLTNRGITQFPDDAVLHELRSLIFFAQGDYLNAAGTIHSVLAVGPGWDWPTLVGMYSDVEIYTAQLRTLEAYVRSHPQEPGPQFLLAYQYMSCGHADTAATYFDNVVRLMPTDRVAMDLKQMLASTIPDSSNPASPPEPLGDNPSENNPSTFQSEALVGTWNASRDDKSQFVLTLGNDSRFSWNFTSPGQDAQSFEGTYVLDNDLLSLNRTEGGTLVGNLSQGSDKQFNFKLIGAPKEDSGLTFAK